MSLLERGRALPAGLTQKQQRPTTRSSRKCRCVCVPSSSVSWCRRAFRLVEQGVYQALGVCFAFNEVLYQRILQSQLAWSTRAIWTNRSSHPRLLVALGLFIFESRNSVRIDHIKEVEALSCISNSLKRRLVHDSSSLRVADLLISKHGKSASPSAPIKVHHSYQFL